MMTDPITYIHQKLAGSYPKGEIQGFTRLIMEQVCGLQPYQLLLGKGTEISDAEKQRIEEIVGRLQKAEPIQYILGEADFGALRFEVTPAVLIPRPETAELVEQICQDHPASGRPTAPWRILDAGTGSGCIAISLACRLGAHASVTALDISPEALAVARRNATRHQVSLHWIQADLLQEQLPDAYCWDLIVSNPPYIAEEEKATMERNVLDFEPARALFVPNEDPLCFYRALARLGQHHLSEQGELYVEINARFGAETVALFEEEGYRKVTLLHDLYQQERFIKAYR